MCVHTVHVLRRFGLNELMLLPVPFQALAEHIKLAAHVQNKTFNYSFQKLI